MNCLHPIAASLAIREQNRTNVLVDDASTYAAVASALEKMGFLNRDDSIAERVAAFLSRNGKP